MKRVTVSITVGENYSLTSGLRKIRSAMVNAAVLKATEENLEIASIEAKVGHVRKAT